MSKTCIKEMAGPLWLWVAPGTLYACNRHLPEVLADQMSPDHTPAMMTGFSNSILVG